MIWLNDIYLSKQQLQQQQQQQQHQQLAGTSAVIIPKLQILLARET